MEVVDNSSEELIEATYHELRQLARTKLAKERDGHTLQPTALVNEAYCRLQQNGNQIEWANREHFLAVAAEVMRRILVEHARRKLTLKRGGNLRRVQQDQFEIKCSLDPSDILSLHEALDQFEKEDPLAAKLVKMRMFAGFGHAEAAQSLNISISKADRIWAFAKARLYLLMTDANVRREPGS